MNFPDFFIKNIFPDFQASGHPAIEIEVAPVFYQS